ncbi:MAG: hotdog fold thioesterase [Flavobacteriaceae bacterium]|nr:hotdog fold thioesterase [Flavobacteriaceae bacterium]
MTKAAQLKKLNELSKNTLLETLDIRYTDVGSDFLTATMPVTAKVYQPAGILHGGATIALAETVGSTAAYLSIDTDRAEVRGLELTANHIRSLKEGMITATARPVHKGRTTQLWEIRIVDEHNKLVSVCKLTTIVLSKK